MKTWFITGASTGLGRCIAERVLEQGDCVAAVSIDPENRTDYPERFGERVMVRYLDVSDAAMAEKVFGEAVERFGKIDVCVNNAGFMLFGAIEEIAPERARSIMDVNFFGTYYLSRLAARHMRENRSGTIIQMSSLAAVDVLAGNGLYGASKWAVEGMSLALAHELKSFGVRVVLIEPGVIKTGIEKRSQTVNDGVYSEVLRDGLLRWRDHDDSGSDGDPVKCAKVIVELAESEKLPARLPLTSFAYEISQTVNKVRFEEAEEWKNWSIKADFNYKGE